MNNDISQTDILFINQNNGSLDLKLETKHGYISAHRDLDKPIKNPEQQKMFRGKSGQPKASSHASKEMLNLIANRE